MVAVGMYEINLCLTGTVWRFSGQLLNGQTSETSIMGALFVTWEKAWCLTKVFFGGGGGGNRVQYVNLVKGNDEKCERT